MIKATTARKVARRSYPAFVKAYRHNGVFKSLDDVVHFLRALSDAYTKLDP